MKAFSLLILGALFASTLSVSAQSPNAEYWRLQRQIEEQNRRAREQFQREYEAERRRVEAENQRIIREMNAAKERERIRLAEIQRQMQEAERRRILRQQEVERRMRRQIELDNRRVAEQVRRAQERERLQLAEIERQNRIANENFRRAIEQENRRQLNQFQGGYSTNVSRSVPARVSRSVRVPQPQNGEWAPTKDSNGSRTVRFGQYTIPSWAKQWRYYKGRVETRPAEDPRAVVARAKARDAGFKSLEGERLKLIQRESESFEKKWFEDQLDRLEKENYDWYQAQIEVLERRLVKDYKEDRAGQKWLRERVLKSVDAEKLKRDSRLKTLRATLLKERDKRGRVAVEGKNIVFQGKRSGWSLSKTESQLEVFDKKKHQAAEVFGEQLQKTLKEIRESWKTSPDVSDVYVATTLLYRSYRTRLNAYASKRQWLKKTYAESGAVFKKLWVQDWLERIENREKVWSVEQGALLQKHLKQFKKGESSSHIENPVLQQLNAERKRRFVFLKKKRVQLENELKARHKQWVQIDKIYQENLDKGVAFDKAQTLAQRELDKEENRQKAFVLALDKERLGEQAEWKKFLGVAALYKREVARYPIVRVHKGKHPFRRRLELKLQQTVDYKEDDLVTVLAEVGKVRGFACIGTTAIFVVDWMKLRDATWDKKDKALAKLIQAAKNESPTRWLLRFDKGELVDLKESDSDLAFSKVRSTPNKDGFKIFYREYSPKKKQLGDTISEFHLKLDLKTNEGEVGTFEKFPTDRDEFEDT